MLIKQITLDEAINSSAYINHIKEVIIREGIQQFGDGGITNCISTPLHAATLVSEDNHLNWVGGCSNVPFKWKEQSSVKRGGHYGNRT